MAIATHGFENGMARECDEKAIIFYSATFCNTAYAQSLAALMTALSERGLNVHLVTYEQPTGSDYITDTRVTRHVLSNYENDGMPTSVALLRILGSINAKTVVICGHFKEREYHCYLAAKALGRCVILSQSQSALLAISSASARLINEYKNAVRGCDGVITVSDIDADNFIAMGARYAKKIPFFFPYDESEVSATQVDDRRIIYYTNYAGRNTRNAIAAFAKLHEKYPDATMHIVLLKTVLRSAAREELLAYINDCELSDCLTIEMKVLKPLRFLREAGISITYANYELIPQTVMESVTLGIPALLMLESDYSGDKNCCDCIYSADTQQIYEKLEYYMNKENRDEFKAAARSNLSPVVRNAIADTWCEEIAKINVAFEARVAKADDCTKALAKSVLDGSFDDTVKKLITDGVPIPEIIGMMLACGLDKNSIDAAFKKQGVLACNYKQYIGYPLSFKNCIEKKIKKGVAPDEAINTVKRGYFTGIEIIVMLSLCGLDNAQITGIIGAMDEKYLHYAFADGYYLLNNLGGNDAHTDKRLAPVETTTSGRSVFNVLDDYFFRTYKAVKYRGRFFVRLATKIHNWHNIPWDDKSIVGKLFSAPFYARTMFMHAFTMHGRKRLNKRKTVEIADGDIRKIQMLVLKMMVEMDRICKKHNLTYYVAGGSILGGVRHKGFIPWDDDMDITMPRPDYDKFIELCQTELPDEYVLERDCVPFCHHRIEIKDSTFNTYLRNGGVFLDILALEGSPDDEALRLQHEKKCKFWRTLMLEKARPLPALNFGSKVVIRVYLLRMLLRFIPRSFLMWRWKTWAKKYDCNETSSWVCLPASIYTYEQERFPKEYWGNPVDLQFEGLTLPTMAHWEDYLICHFGDYMKMPPVTTRKSHHFIFAYSLGKYADMTAEEIEKQVYELRDKYAKELMTNDEKHSTAAKK